MSEDNVLVSIVIPHWNGIEILSECLASLTQTSYHPYEIIVVDNCSKDGSQRWIKNTYPNITLIENSKNYGYAGGCNRGIQNANGELVVFLNNDTIQNPMWLGQLVEFIVKNPKIAALQPKILNYFDKSFFDYAGGAGGYMDIFGFPFARGRIFIEQEKDHGQYDDKKQCFWASGTALMVRKNLFIEAGSFDETFFAHMEEIDLCWRLKNINPKCKIVTIGKSKVYHIGGGTIQYDNPKKNYFNFRNSITMLIKNLPGKFLIPVILLRILSDFIILIFSIFTLKIRFSFSIIKAYYYNILNIRYNFGKRGISRTSNKYYYTKSILLAYYLFRKKTFSALK